MSSGFFKSSIIYKLFINKLYIFNMYVYEENWKTK